MERNPYRVLGLEPGASPREVKRAWRTLVRRWHPDRNDAPEAEARFVEIQAAYEALQDPDTRRRASGDRAGRRGPDLEGGPPLEFLRAFTDAVERAEVLVFQVVLPRVGPGATGAALLARDLADGTALDDLSPSTWWARWRARRWARRVQVVIDYHPLAPPSRTMAWRYGRTRWLVELGPAAFWRAGVREPGDLDDRVALHLAGQVTAILAAERGARGLDPEAAREVDAAAARWQRIQLALVLALAGLSAAMLYAGYMDRFS